MSKIKFAKHPRSIIQSRKDHPSTLTVTIPKKIVQATQLKAGDILEFQVLVEGTKVLIKAGRLESMQGRQGIATSG